VRRLRTRLPTDVASALDLHPGERALAWANGPSGEWYVGTDLAIHLPAQHGYRRLGWEDVERAEWHHDSDKLAIVEVADWGEPERTTVVEVTEPGRLLELLRERVTKSVVCTVYSRVRGKAGLSVVGRRSPSGRGPTTWSYVLSVGLDPADPQVEEVAARALADARHELEDL
jgi:hypothetical protein